jgi:CheY-like chemotaxis protein
MAIHDLDKARAAHGALVALFLREPACRDNAKALVSARSLCDAAVDAVNDVDARVAIRAVKHLANLFFADDGHLDVESELAGPEAVRLRILNALSEFRGRIQTLEARAPSRPEIPALAPKHLRVLVVEDNRDSAETLRALLELCGYAVTVAHSAREGLDAAKELRPDVVLCDIGLPDTDGFHLAETLHRDPDTASAHLIAVTAYGKQEDKQRSAQVGFKLHLVKPVNPGTILQVLEDIKRSPPSAEGNVVTFPSPQGRSGPQVQ